MQDVPPTKYSHKTRIGNWSEEQELEETKLKDFLKLKDSSSLQSNKLQGKIDQSMVKASLSYPKDGLLHFGHHIMLFNEKTEAYLVSDIKDRLGGVEEGYMVTTSKTAFPCARSVFVLKKFEKDLFTDDIIHYGQKIQIQINPLYTSKELYLHSCPLSPGRASKISRKQEAGFFSKTNFNTAWVVEHVDPNIRFETKGFEPVKNGDSVLLKHALTGQWLASDNILYKSDFGGENEVFCQSFQSLNKTQNLIAEKTGRTTTDIPSRNQSNHNHWVLRGATDSSQEFDETILFKALTGPEYIAMLKKKLIQKGENGIRGLRASFKKCDPNRNYVLDKDDFKWGLRNYGIVLNFDELGCIFQLFDPENHGVIDYRNFVDALNTPISAKRGKLVEKHYNHIQAKLGKDVRMETLVTAFDASRHSDVIARKATEKEIFRVFLSGWEDKKPEDPVSFDEFLEYYTDVSTTIDKDETFEGLINTTWKC
jgi:hypothetical protein